jgi:hypothetical protein
VEYQNKISAVGIYFLYKWINILQDKEDKKVGQLQCNIYLKVVVAVFTNF